MLENYFFHDDLETQIDAFVANYNCQRYHESIDNLIPADAYVGRGRIVLLERERIKRKTIAKSTLASPNTSCLTSQTRCAKCPLKSLGLLFQNP